MIWTKIKPSVTITYDIWYLTAFNYKSFRLQITKQIIHQCFATVFRLDNHDFKGNLNYETRWWKRGAAISPWWNYDDTMVKTWRGNSAILLPHPCAIAYSPSWFIVINTLTDQPSTSIFAFPSWKLLFKTQTVLIKHKMTMNKPWYDYKIGMIKSRKNDDENDGLVNILLLLRFFSSNMTLCSFFNTATYALST